MIHYFKDGMTVRELKALVKNLEEKDEHGEEYEVWVESGAGLSSPVHQASSLNKGDIFLGYSYE